MTKTKKITVAVLALIMAALMVMLLIVPKKTYAMYVPQQSENPEANYAPEYSWKNSNTVSNNSASMWNYNIGDYLDWYGISMFSSAGMGGNPWQLSVVNDNLNITTLTQQHTSYGFRISIYSDVIKLPAGYAYNLSWENAVKAEPNMLVQVCYRSATDPNDIALPTGGLLQGWEVGSTFFVSETNQYRQIGLMITKDSINKSIVNINVGSPLLKQGKDLYAQGYDKGYSQGFEQGNKTGYESGYGQGLTAGKEEGYNTGYQEGYNKGKEDGANMFGFVANIGQAPFTFIQNMLNFEILGVNMASLVTSLFTAALVVVLLKLFV